MPTVFRAKPPAQDSNNTMQSRILCNETYYLAPSWGRTCRIHYIPPSSSARRDRWDWCSRKEDHKAPLQLRAESHRSISNHRISKLDQAEQQVWLHMIQTLASSVSSAFVNIYTLHWAMRCDVFQYFHSLSRNCGYWEMPPLLQQGTRVNKD